MGAASPHHLNVAGRKIGGGAPCFVIAEAGVNHNGDVALAERLVDVAAASGADAVKFQTFQPGRLVSPDAQKAAYQIETTGAGESQAAMLEKLALPDAAWARLKARAEAQGILFLSTPFDEASADLLVRLGVPALKIASGEVTNHLLLRHVARLGVPVLLSTGMATLDEVVSARAALRDAGDPALALFHCVSSYPATAADCNLNAMAAMRSVLGVPVGFSDHTLGLEVAFAAAALGAELFEKHLTLDRAMPGPDHRASIEPAEMKTLVEGVRAIEAALGDGQKVPRPAEVDVRTVARRSLFWGTAKRKGERVTVADLIALRPEGGMSPARLDRVIGRVLARDVVTGVKVSEGDLG